MTSPLQSRLDIIAGKSVSSKERKIRKEREQPANESNSLSSYTQFYGMERTVVVRPKVSAVEER